METKLFEAASPYINSTLFGYDTVQELFEAELNEKKDDVDSSLSVIRDLNRRSRRTLALPIPVRYGLFIRSTLLIIFEIFIQLV